MTTTAIHSPSPVRRLVPTIGAAIPIAFAVGISWWSLTGLAVQYGIPLPLAIGASAVFDGAAIYLGSLARSAAMEGDSGFTDRLYMFALVAASAGLNYWHASLRGGGLGEQAILVASPMVAAVVIERGHAHEQRAARRARGLVPERLPVAGFQGWGLHTLRTLRNIWVASRKNLDVSLERHEAALAVSRAKIRATIAEATRDVLSSPYDATRPATRATTRSDELSSTYDATRMLTGTTSDATRSRDEKRDEDGDEAATDATSSSSTKPATRTTLSAPSRGTTKRATKKAKKYASKAEAIRNAIDANPDAENDEIVEVLASLGVTVTGRDVRDARYNAKRAAKAAGVVQLRKGGRLS